MNAVELSHEELEAGREAVESVLLCWLPPEQATERARNIAAALSDGVTEPLVICCAQLRRSLADAPLHARVVAPRRAAEAWGRAVLRTLRSQ